MGFPLSKGTVKDSILTCHWHHARFDLNNGGTFDQPPSRHLETIRKQATTLLSLVFLI
jgi:nitrite reductase/ring-hydroxylating ferredoxin subunit